MNHMHVPALRTVQTRVLMALAFVVIATLAATQAQALNLGRLKGQVFGQGNTNLVIILHGDSGDGRDRMADLARKVARAAPGTTAVALTRPGFDGKTGRSPGENSTKDHYTKKNNRLLAESISAMRQSLAPGRVIVLGHSGGAAQTAIVNGMYPGLIDVPILVGCPCDVPSWRFHRRGENNWTQSQSPHDFAKNLRPGAPVVLLTNGNDSNTLPRFAKEYAALAQSAGARVALHLPRGGGHGFRFYEQRSFDLIKQYLQ